MDKITLEMLSKLPTIRAEDISVAPIEGNEPCILIIVSNEKDRDRLQEVLCKQTFSNIVRYAKSMKEVITRTPIAGYVSKNVIDESLVEALEHRIRARTGWGFALIGFEDKDVSNGN